MSALKKNDPAFVNKKREYKKTGRMNEIDEEEKQLAPRKAAGVKHKEKPLIDASSDSIVDPPFLEVYESEFDFYRRERKKIQN